MRPSVCFCLSVSLSVSVRVTNSHHNYSLSGPVCWPLNSVDLIMKWWVRIPPRAIPPLPFSANALKEKINSLLNSKAKSFLTFLRREGLQFCPKKRFHFQYDMPGLNLVMDEIEIIWTDSYNCDTIIGILQSTSSAGYGVHGWQTFLGCFHVSMGNGQNN